MLLCQGDQFGLRHGRGEGLPVERQHVGQAVAVLGEEGGALVGVEDALAAPERPGHLLVEADVGLHRADAVVGEEHDVGMLLQQRRGAGVQLDDVAVVGFVLGAVEALDVGVGDLDHRHAALVAQRVQPVEVLAPEVERRDVALAVARLFDRGPAVVACRPAAQISGSSQSTLSITTVPNSCVLVVERVERLITSAKLVASGKCGTCSVPSPSSVVMNTGRSASAAKVVLPTPATPWIRMRGGRQRRGRAQGCERDGHQRTSSPSTRRNLGLPVRTVRAGSNSSRICCRPGVVLALGDAEGDVDVVGGIGAVGPDALDKSGELRLVPFDPFRQVGDHGDSAVLEADRSGVLAGIVTAFCSTVSVFQGDGTIEPI